MRRYKPLFEQKNWITVQKLDEGLRLSDLTRNQGMSDITKYFKKRRSSLLGAESRIAKLIDVEVDETAKHVTFVWLTEVTPDMEVYGDDYRYKEVDIEGKQSIRSNSSKTYELKIRILDFFSWLDVFEGEKITPKQIKEIFEVSDIQVSSNDPSWQYQGFNYKMSSEFDASIYPTNIPDPVWGPRHNDNGLLSKHLQGLVNGISFWRNPMATMLNKKLNDRGLL